MRRKMVMVFMAVVLGVMLVGCKPVQSICDDAPKYTKAISGVDAKNPEFKSELLEDVSEAATEARCPGYDTHDQD